MPRLPLVLLAIVALVVSGCLGATTDPTPDGSPEGATGLPEPTFAAVKAEVTPFTASDGVLLDMWTFRPDAEGEFPVLLQDSPYYGNLDPPLADEGQAFSQWLIRTFVPRGYAVVLKSVRGTGDSGGCFNMGDPREALDGAEVVEWLAEQPWSNGNVAMIGKSYRGTTPIQTAVLAPPHLKTIVPIAGITEWFLYTNSPGGVPYTGWVGFNARYWATVGVGATPDAEAPGLTPRYAEDVCPGTAELFATEGRSLATGEYHEGWDLRNYAKDVSKMTASVYLVHGLVDFNVKPDQVGAWFNQVPTFKHALLGQWPHEYPDREDWALDLFEWFEHELKGADNGIERDPPVKVEASTGEWRFESQWPPERAVAESFYLMGDGSIARATPGDATGSLAFTATPASEPNGAAGTGPSQLVFTTGALDAPLHVVGTPFAFLNASADRPATTIAVEMYDVADGEWTPINWAFLDTRHRESVRESDPLLPIEVATMPLQFFPMDHVFEAGHELAIAIAGADPDWITNAPSGASTTIRLGADARLALSTIQGVMREEPQPATRDFEELDWYQESAG